MLRTGVDLSVFVVEEGENQNAVPREEVAEHSEGAGRRGEVQLQRRGPRSAEQEEHRRLEASADPHVRASEHGHREGHRLGGTRRDFFLI